MGHYIQISYLSDVHQWLVAPADDRNFAVFAKIINHQHQRSLHIPFDSLPLMAEIKHRIDEESQTATPSDPGEEYNALLYLAPFISYNHVQEAAEVVLTNGFYFPTFTF